MKYIDYRKRTADEAGDIKNINEVRTYKIQNNIDVELQFAPQEDRVYLKGQDKDIQKLIEKFTFIKSV